MKYKFLAAILAGTMLITLTACAQQNQEEPQVLLVQEEEGDTYPVTTAEYGEVTKSVTISCVYISTEQQEFSFPFDGRLIERVDVKTGDYVTKGQLLAALDVEDLEEEIEKQQYEIARLELEKKHTEELRDFDLASAETMYQYTHKKQRDKEALKDKKEEITKQYKTPVEDLEDALFLARGRLEQNQEKLKGGRLEAPMSGQVTYCKKSLVDTYSVKDETVVIVSNQDACYFVAEDTEWADYFTEGEPVELEYRIPGGQQTCELLPALTEQWGELLYFKPVGEELWEIGTEGKITAELDRKTNVLCVPTNAVCEADNGKFVYLVKDGLLEMRYVTVGLEGEAFVEIVDGLEQGDVVALKK